MDAEVRVRHFLLYDVREDHTFDSPIANRRMGHRVPDSFDERIRRPLDVTESRRGVHGGHAVPIGGKAAAGGARLLGHRGLGEGCCPGTLRTAVASRVQRVHGDHGRIATGMARLLRECGVRRGLVVNWINQYSSDPDWHEDKALPIWWGDLWVNDGGCVRPRHR